MNNEQQLIKNLIESQQRQNEERLKAIDDYYRFTKIMLWACFLALLVGPFLPWILK